MSADDVKGLDLDDDTITLVSSDNIETVVAKRIAMQSGLVRVMTDGDKSATRMPLQVQDDIMKKIVEYMKAHDGNPAKPIAKPLKTASLLDATGDQKDVDYIEKMDDAFLFRMIEGSSYLEVTPLMELCCCKVATLMFNVQPRDAAHALGHPQGDIPMLDEESEKQITESLTWIEAERGPGIRAAHGIPDVVTPAPAAAQ